MNIETFREYCKSKKAVTETFPFDETTLVFKVMDKMFAITDTHDDFKIALKCDPDKAIELRENFEAVSAGWHLNKRHWNTILIDDSISDILLKEWIDESYKLVVKKMTKKEQKYLDEMD